MPDHDTARKQAQLAEEVLKTLDWRVVFDERQINEIEFSRTYVAGFNHGTDGHHAKQIIDKMSRLLGIYEGKLTELRHIKPELFK